MRVKSWFAAACVALAASIGVASAQTRSALTADEIATVLAEAGLNPTIAEDAGSGLPVVRGQLGQIVFFVRALDCDGAPKACSTLLFFANFSIGRNATEEDFKKVNRFTESQVFGRAYVIEGRGEIGVDYAIELDGGVSMEHVTANVSRWADVVSAFLDSMRSGAGSS